MSYPKIHGVSRVADNDKVLLVSFHQKPSDYELREFHELIRENSIDGIDNFLANLQSSGIRKEH